jgi:hypothetical protein
VNAPLFKAGDRVVICYGEVKRGKVLGVTKTPAALKATPADDLDYFGRFYSVEVDGEGVLIPAERSMMDEAEFDARPIAVKK